MSAPLVYTFSPEHLVVAVHIEGTVYSFTKDGAPLFAVTNPRNQVILRALLEAALADLDAQVDR